MTAPSSLTPGSSLRQSGTIVTMRLTRGEYQQLITIARSDGDTLSAVIREALYRVYGVGWPSDDGNTSPLPARHTIAAGDHLPRR
jgi:hypothetical protein